MESPRDSLEMDQLNTPLIKETHLPLLVHALQCFEKWPLNREKQKTCVLASYNAKAGQDLAFRDKSIFRGMVVSSLRQLGFIVGDGDYLRVSSNGHLVVVASQLDARMRQQVLAVLFYEIDKQSFHFLDLIDSLRGDPGTTEDALTQRCSTGPNSRQRRERVLRWLRLLRDVHLVTEANGCLVPSSLWQEAPKDLSVNQSDIYTWFKAAVFQAYDEVKGTSGIVDIIDLRACLAENELMQYDRIVTRNRFDRLMQKLSFEGQGYILSFGSPISGGQELLEYREHYYKTLIINRAKGGENNA